MVGWTKPPFHIVNFAQVQVVKIYDDGDPYTKAGRRTRTGIVVNKIAGSILVVTGYRLHLFGLGIGIGAPHWYPLPEDQPLAA